MLWLLYAGLAVLFLDVYFASVTIMGINAIQKQGFASAKIIQLVTTARFVRLGSMVIQQEEILTIVSHVLVYLEVTVF